MIGEVEHEKAILVKRVILTPWCVCNTGNEFFNEQKYHDAVKHHTAKKKSKRLEVNSNHLMCVTVLYKGSIFDCLN